MFDQANFSGTFNNILIDLYCNTGHYHSYYLYPIHNHMLPFATQYYLDINYNFSDSTLPQKNLRIWLL